MGFLSKIPILGGVVDTLTGKPVAQQQQTMSAEQKAAFKPSEAQNKYLDYAAQQLYGGPSAQANEYQNILKAQMEGKGPSVAQEMLNQQSDKTAAQAAGLMGSARGVQNPALLAKQAAQQGAELSQQQAGQAATLRAQEMGAATGAYGQQLGQQEQLGLQKGAALSGAQNTQQQAGIQGAQAEMNMNAANVAGANAAAGEAKKAQMGAISGIASMAMMSDKNAKKDIKGGSGAMESFLDSLSSQPPEAIAGLQNFLDTLNPYEYKYKQDRLADGNADHLGVMAQDVEKSPVGKPMVKNTAEGKKIKPDAGTILAAAAYNNDRIKDLENEVKQVKEMGPQPVMTAAPMESMPVMRAGQPEASRGPSSVGDTYYQGAEKRMQVPEFDQGKFAIDEAGKIVELNKLPVKPVRRADQSLPTSAMQAPPADMAKIKDYLDMVNNMERANAPLPEKFKTTRK